MAVVSGAYKRVLKDDQQPKEVLVKVDRITKQLDGTLVVDIMSLTINKDEIFTLFGGPGPGKSTLLCILVGSGQPIKGRIFLDDRDITGLSPREQPVNMMF